MIKVLSAFGTRPEAIKMCPLIKEMERCSEIESVVCLTGQHREMLAQVMNAFQIEAKYNLDIMRDRQTLFTITSDILVGVEDVLEREKPDVVLVHGDTTTSFSVALAAFYKQIDVGHIEAGLRTHDKYSPFPEEMNRTLLSRIAKYHFAPTMQNVKNLWEENIRANIFITGNTVIDAFKTTINPCYTFSNPVLRSLNFADKRIVLVTAHRRENLGRPLENICEAIIELTERYEDIQVVYPVHLNPAVREPVHKLLGGHERISLIDPIDVMDMHNLIARSYLVLTDSGGLQEEVPHFGVPVLVLRVETERPEAVEAGVVKVVGVDTQNIVNNASLLLEDDEVYDQMSEAVNPYGDGNASYRIIDALLANIGNRSFTMDVPALANAKFAEGGYLSSDAKRVMM